MESNNDIRYRWCGVFHMSVQWIVVAKCQRKVFGKEAINTLRAPFTKARSEFDSQLVETDSERNHGRFE